MPKLDNPPCKLSFTHWDETITIEKDHSDITFDDFIMMTQTLARAFGLTDEHIKEYFNV